jgi:hypothetical protein
MRTLRVDAASADRVVRHSNWGQGMVESSSCASDRWSSVPDGLEALRLREPRDREHPVEGVLVSETLVSLYL